MAVLGVVERWAVTRGAGKPVVIVVPRFFMDCRDWDEFFEEDGCVAHKIVTAFGVIVIWATIFFRVSFLPTSGSKITAMMPDTLKNFPDIRKLFLFHTVLRYPW